MFLKSEHLKNKHGFFTRLGGVSSGEFASLNCGFGSGEDKNIVQQNRDIALKAISGKTLITTKQTHSDITQTVNSADAFYEGDALVTDKEGLALGILTADCGVVLLEDAKAHVIGAIHAGWKGARFGIIGSAIRAMQNLGAQEITAVIGPCIQQKSYEVAADFTQVFASEGAQNAAFFEKAQKDGHIKDGHFMFNLTAYIEMKLKKNGVENIYNLNEDTLSQPEKFYSYRRGTLAGKTEYGRQISIITL